jgi:ubiquinone/menaquinone biosynthesis C-methylase UbiE
MTDMQFKAYTREQLKHLKKALEESPDNKTLKEMIESLEETLRS